MNLLFTAGRELSYPRNAMLYELLQEQFQVKFIGRRSGRRNLLLQSAWNAFKCTPYLRSKEVLLSVVGFYGHLIMLWAGRAARQPILFDAFISTYDTLCFDRKVISPNSPAGRLAKWLDEQACRLADRVLVDTQAQADFFHDTLGVPREKLDVLYVGCDEKIFYPRSTTFDENLVLFYGEFLPLHNIEVILQAAQLVMSDGIHFQIIGPFGKHIKQKQLNQAHLTNVEFIPPVPLEQLPSYISRAAICLGGHFGASEKAGRVIAGKTFQCIAMGKPTIVGDNPANRELLVPGKDAWFCKMNDAQALSEAIKSLWQDKPLQSYLGKNAREAFLQKASKPILRRKLKAILQKISI
mgnify:CR=1 FL=1